MHLLMVRHNVIKNSQRWREVFLRHLATPSPSSRTTQKKQVLLSWLRTTPLLEWVPLFFNYNKVRRHFLHALEESALILKVTTVLLKANYKPLYMALVNSKHSTVCEIFFILSPTLLASNTWQPWSCLPNSCYIGLWSWAMSNWKEDKRGKGL